MLHAVQIRKPAIQAALFVSCNCKGFCLFGGGARSEVQAEVGAVRGGEVDNSEEFVAVFKDASGAHG
jgi:hypothetical protein